VAESDGSRAFDRWCAARGHGIDVRVAAVCGVSKEVVGQWRRGRSQPGAMLRAVLRHLTHGEVLPEAWWAPEELERFRECVVRASALSKALEGKVLVDDREPEG